jgi:hypothetical protein
MALALGDLVRYRSIAGTVYDAVVTAVEPFGVVALDVDAGAKDPVSLRGVSIDRIEPREDGEAD